MPGTSHRGIRVRPGVDENADDLRTAGKVPGQSVTPCSNERVPPLASLIRAPASPAGPGLLRHRLGHAAPDFLVAPRGFWGHSAEDTVTEEVAQPTAEAHHRARKRARQPRARPKR